MSDEKKRLRFSDINRKLGVSGGGGGDAQGAQPAEGTKTDAPSRQAPLPPPASPRLLPRQPRFGASSAPSRPSAPPDDEREDGDDRPQRPVVAAANPAPAVQAALQGQPSAPAGETDEQEEEFDIYRYLSVLLRRKAVIVIAALIVGLFSAYSFFTAKKYYTSYARMLFSPGSQEIVSDQFASWQEWGTRDKKLNTHLELLKSDKEVLRRVSEALDGQVSPGAIEGGMTVTRGETKGEQTDIIELRYRNRNPDLARDVLNLLCKTYVDYIREVKAQDITTMILKFEDQIAKVEGELKEKEDALRQFKENNRLVQLSDEANTVVTKVSDMEVALQQTQLDLLATKERLGAIERQMSKQSVDVVNSITYQDLYRNRLSELEFERNTLAAEYSPDHYKVQMVQNEIAKIKEAIKANATTKSVQTETFIKNPIRESLVQELVTLNIDKASLDARRQAQEQTVERLNGELMKLPLLEQKYATLQRQTESLIQTLQMLKSQYEKAKIKRDSQEVDLKILQLSETPRVGISDVKANRIWVGLAVGLILGIALAFLIEYLDQTIKEPRDVEKTLELPLLGVLPLLEGEKAVIDFASEKGKARLEPFRALRTNLKHLAGLHSLKTFIVCSAVKGEGKTTLAANLAISFAMDSKKVILVDGDLRRPQIHALMGIPKQNGLSDYMTGDREDVRQILKPTKYEGLRVVTSGERPHNPTELLGTQRFDQLVAELRTQADIVIFDSPALLPVSDAITMAPKMDGCVVVARTLWTPIKAARQAKAQLDRIGTNMLGAVLNGISHSRGYYPYYYGYYRYYAYKYTYEYDEEPRKRRSVREMGLAIEAKVREMIQGGRFSPPRLVAVSGRLLGDLGKDGLFWTLAFLFVASLLLAPMLKTKKDAVFPSRHIEYLDGNAGVTLPSAGAEAPGPGGTPLESAGRQAAPAGPETAAQADMGPGGVVAWGSDLKRWQRALAGYDLASCLSYYDTIGFSYPRGTLGSWSSEIAVDFARDAARFDTTFVVGSKADPMGTTFMRSITTVAFVKDLDTSRVDYVQIWQQRASGWRIIREKRGGGQ